MARLEQICGHRFAHSAGADESNLHGSHPSQQAAAANDIALPARRRMRKFDDPFAFRTCCNRAGSSREPT
jgi:hypothetical protein